MKKARYFLIVLIVLFACKESKKKEDKGQLNSLNEITNVVDLEGGAVSMSMFKGKKVLVNFWATWCGPCKQEMPDLLSAQEILKKENYKFILISDESQEKILEFKENTKYDFTFLRSTKATNLMGIYALPTTFVYNEKGVKSKKIVGAVQWNSEKMLNNLKNVK